MLQNNKRETSAERNTRLERRRVRDRLRRERETSAERDTRRKKDRERQRQHREQETHRQETFDDGQTQENDSTQEQKTSNTSQAQQLHSIQELTQQDRQLLTAFRDFNMTESDDQDDLLDEDEVRPDWIYLAEMTPNAINSNFKINLGTRDIDQTYDWTTATKHYSNIDVVNFVRHASLEYQNTENLIIREVEDHTLNEGQRTALAFGPNLVNLFVS
ncbi:10378_t:CDS:2 [Cetraspora pellucida]|uniref:10378_t:CDS:1 n=1 Tax=Cetraspora pellucida TaxID=1433469 RepID=A0ACA9K4E4_9GLOM|nr:10378_t:CDS:2 [Cetraspora pellucida]